MSGDGKTCCSHWLSSDGEMEFGLTSWLVSGRDGAQCNRDDGHSGLHRCFLNGEIRVWVGCDYGGDAS